MFAWSHEDMPKIDPTIVVHRLNFNHSRCSIKHKRRAINSKKNKIAVKEVEKLQRANLIQELRYPKWLSNVLLIKKLNGK